MKKINEEIGDRVRRIRQDHDETQEDLARVLGKGNKAVSRCEKGHTAFSIDEVLKIAQHYGMKVGDVIGEKRDDGFTDQEIMLVREFRELDMEGRNNLLFFVFDLLRARK